MYGHSQELLENLVSELRLALEAYLRITKSIRGPMLPSQIMNPLAFIGAYLFQNTYNLRNIVLALGRSFINELTPSSPTYPSPTTLQGCCLYSFQTKLAQRRHILL